MKEIPVYQYGQVVAYAMVDDEDFEVLTRHKWHLNNKGYPRRTQLLETPKQAKAAGRTSKRSVCIYMSRFLLGLEKDNPLEADHIDRNPLNNQRVNLRIATRTQNMQNVRSFRGSSQYRGVTKEKRSGKWRAYGTLNRKRVWLGLHTSEEEAEREAREWRVLNMPHAYD